MVQDTSKSPSAKANSRVEKVLICIGSNVTDRCVMVDKATEMVIGLLIEPRITPLLSSSDYLNKGNDYTNRLVTGLTDRSIEELLDAFSDHETQSGRTPQSKYQGVMPIDIDLVRYGDRLVKPSLSEQPFFKELLTHLI